MTLSRLGTVVIIVTLLSTTSCDRFSIRSKGAKPTQVVDLPSMIGKSGEEITKMVGIPPSKLNWGQAFDSSILSPGCAHARLRIEESKA